MRKTFDYGNVCIKDLKADVSETKGVHRIDKLYVAGRPVHMSARFWQSLRQRFAFSPTIFRYFSHAEVFDRIAKRAKNAEIRYCIESDKEGRRDTILAVTNPHNPYISYEQLHGLVHKYGASKVEYANGVLTSTHSPRIGAEPAAVGPDLFSNRFVIDAPVDGFGKPSVYLSMMRLVCTNGLIGYAKAFRSELAVGKNSEDVAHSLVRAMDSFNNEEGYGAIRQRLDAGQRSWASVREANKAYKTLGALAVRGQLTLVGKELVRYGEDGHLEEVETNIPVFARFHKMTGDIHETYGLNNIDALSSKKQRALPVNCKVADLVNFMSELATHHATPDGARSIQALLGDMLGDAGGFDLEGTADRVTEFADFFVKDEAAIQAARLARAGINRGGDDLIAAAQARQDAEAN